MATITLEVPEELATRLEDVGERLPALLTFALDIAGIPGRTAAADRVPVWDEVIAFLGRTPSQAEIIDFKLSDEAQDRM